MSTEGRIALFVRSIARAIVAPFEIGQKRSRIIERRRSSVKGDCRKATKMVTSGDVVPGMRCREM
jgi:hypothetical protein